MLRSLLVACSLAVLSACQTSAAPPPACAMAVEDEAWIARSISAWRFATHTIGGFDAPQGMQAVFFDDDCVRTSGNAMGGTGAPVWSSAAHAGMIALPGGDEMPAGITSFATAGEGYAFFVMAAPSIWRAGGVDGAPMGLETLMTGVLLHEGSHVAQVQTYGARIDRLSAQYQLPQEFNDDSVQRQFESDAAFAASVARETELLLAAAAAADDGEARRLAGEARAMMRARAAQYFTGANAYYGEAEDIWLTMEGSGQWLAYQWMINPDGAGFSAAEAIPAFGQRGRWWSQKQGFALFMALDRLTDGSWRATVFGDGAHTGLKLLDRALES